jgi:tetratricopeptide (TPR) repeat protein
MGVLKQVWATITGQRRPSSLDLFRRAERCRQEGRFEEALALVSAGLELHPDHVLGHLLSGYVHAALREMGAAREQFERVLAVDPYHPRALLALARLAFEAGDVATCRQYLERATRAYPDFPEAQALGDVLAATTAMAGPALDRIGSLRPDVLRVPADSRDLFLAQADGAVVFSHAPASLRDDLATHAARALRIAAAVLSRAGLGSLRRAVIERAGETTFLHADSGLILSLSFDPGAELGPRMALGDRLLATCVDELRRSA